MNNHDPYQYTASNGYYVPQGNASTQPSGSQPPQRSAETFLSEIFPTVNKATITAILASTNGETGPAYNALLAISGQNSQPPPSGPHTQPQQHSQPGSSPYISHNGHASPAMSPQFSHQTSYHEPQQPATQYAQPYLAPTFSASSTIAPPPMSHRHSQSGSITPLYPAASPNLSSVDLHPPPYSQGPQGPQHLPDLDKLSLSGSSGRKLWRKRHWASCDGCSANDFEGKRWNCTACPDYDLCDECMWAKVHNHHRFVQLPIDAEIHGGYDCDGCGVAGKVILGSRYHCKTHDNEDYCGRCIQSGKGCGGPYEEVKTTTLGRQIELEGCIPMPPEWTAYLQPVVAEYSMSVSLQDAPAHWNEIPASMDVYDLVRQDRGNVITRKPVFTIKITQSKGHFISDHKYEWYLRDKQGNKLYTYLQVTDRKSGALKNEQFGEYKGKSFRPVWKRSSKMDTLNFQDPKTGTHYCWVSNRPVSTLGEERFDFQRLALFERRGGKEIIVADFTWWDGYEKETGECLAIRDRNIDPAMVVASYYIVTDHQWRVLQEERTRDPEGVAKAEERARLTKYGIASYWLKSDYVTPAAGGSGGRGGGSSSIPVSGIMHLAHAGMDFGSAIAGASGGDSSGGGGGGGGGDSGGGGGGC